ncbi:MAG: oligoendopeptidase F, partial [Rhodospirillales bacterium]
MTEPAHDLGDLPNWDLTDLYSGINDPKLEADLSECGGRSATFEKTWKSNLIGIDAKSLKQAIVEYEAIDEILSRIMSFAGLLHAGDLSDSARGQFMQNMSERATDI